MDRVWAALMAVFCSLFHFSVSLSGFWLAGASGDAGPSCRRLVLQPCFELMCEKFVPREPDTRA